MRKVANYIEDKFVDLFAPEGEDKDVADDFDRDLFGKNRKQ